jgi:hypothetical protein
VQATRFGARVLLVVPSKSRVRRLFSITRLDRVLRVTETRAEALST